MDFYYLYLCYLVRKYKKFYTIIEKARLSSDEFQDFFKHSELDYSTYFLEPDTTVALTAMARAQYLNSRIHLGLHIFEISLSAIAVLVAIFK